MRVRDRVDSHRLVKIFCWALCHMHTIFVLGPITWNNRIEGTVVMKQAPTPQLLSDQKYFSTKQLTDLTLNLVLHCTKSSMHQVLYLSSALRDGLRKLKGVAFNF